MTVLFAVVALLLSLVAWAGQLLSAVAPRLAVTLGLTEAAEEVDPTFLADVRAEAVWDALTLWTLPLASSLLLLAAPGWPFLGLVGGGTYVYFSGRGVAQRVVMRRRGIAVGKPESLRTYYVFLVLWGSVGGAMIGLASAALLGRG